MEPYVKPTVTELVPKAELLKVEAEVRDWTLRFNDLSRSLDGIRASERAAIAEAATLRGKVEKLRSWLDSNTTHFDPETASGPFLADISKRIWYHATDDTESFPFTELIGKALERNG